jgi:diacylglycerol O-acyltransferase/trehalose O-mycolyltransferase
VARGWSPLYRWPAPVRVAWRTMLAVIVVLGGAACGGDANARPETRSAGGVAHLRVVATTVLSARMRDLTVASPALGATVKVRLLLPVHYAARPGARWPVLYLLHGCCDTYRSWTRSTDVAALTAHSDVLVVMPDGGKAGFTPTG